MSCLYATANGGDLPGWNCHAGTNAQAGTFTDTQWDSYQMGMGAAGSPYAGTSSIPVAPWATFLRWSMVGSGPYYLSYLSPATSYTLKASPTWKGTTCSWTGCIPAIFPVTTVNEVWEDTATEGEVAFQNGQADLATIPGTDMTSVLIPMLHAGTASIASNPGLSIGFTNFVLNFSQSGAQGLLPSGDALNAPSDLFQDLAFRQFLIHAYPYQTIQSQYNTIDGIPNTFLYGGAIPIGMGNYYPGNISWANQDPDVPPSTSPSSPTYWWNQVEAESGAGDIAKAACTTAKPCTFPFPSEAGAPVQDLINDAWTSEISKYSNGAVNVIEVDISFGNLVANSFAAPGTNPMPMYELAWVPDFPDPTDYTGPMYSPDSTYTYGDALAEGLGLAGTYASPYMGACPASYVWQVDAVTQACQGTAYTQMVAIMNAAAFDTNLDQRVLLYNAAEHIAQQLGIFTPNPGQAISGWTVAGWIDSSSLNANPCIGGGGDNTWYSVQYES
jgi:hypothetical protein